MSNKKIKLRFNNAPTREKPKEKKRKPDLGKLLGSLALLPACSKKKDPLFDDSHPKIVDHEDGTQTIVGLEESMIRPFGNDGIEVDIWDVAYIAAILLVLRFSKFKPPKSEKGPNEDRG